MSRQLGSHTEHGRFLFLRQLSVITVLGQVSLEGFANSLFQFSDEQCYSRLLIWKNALELSLLSFDSPLLIKRQLLQGGKAT